MPQRGKSKKSAVRVKSVSRRAPPAAARAKPKSAGVKAKAKPVKAAAPRLKPAPDKAPTPKPKTALVEAAALKSKNAPVEAAATQPKAALLGAAARSAGAPSRDSKSTRLPRWIQDHLDRYLATNGADGHVWRGMPTLLLTTIGRKSGEERMLPLIYGRDGDRYVVVASKGGAPEHPAWYQNLIENPEVRVQVGSHRFRARARTANRDERPRLWRAMTKLFPAYDQYQSRTGREIPVVLIQRH
jgi:deazaflavin-dependent oxidoreductase (nitroreductase family)